MQEYRGYRLGGRGKPVKRKILKLVFKGTYIYETKGRQDGDEGTQGGPNKKLRLPPLRKGETRGGS